MLGSPSHGFAILALLVGAGAEAEPTPLPPPEGARRLDERVPLWVDQAGGRVLVDGSVVHRAGILEMFACPVGTKEHESIVAVNSPAFLIHTALLAVGAEPGEPVRHQPEYRPPSGDRIEVTVVWHADGQRQTARAQQWVRDAETGEEMHLPFVFAGSGFFTDHTTGRQTYQAEEGDLICVSNFASATLDVPAPSTDANDALWFEPFTERIPPEETPVRLILTPKKGPLPEPPRDLPTLLSAIRRMRVGLGATDLIRDRWSLLRQESPGAILQVLAAMKDATPLAENWLRMAIDTVAEQHAPEDLPVDRLEGFLADTEQSPRARRTAWELIRRADADRAAALLPALQNDPSEELRYDAVALLVERTESADAEAAEALFRQVIASARALDQFETAERGLKKLGLEVKLADELGFVTQWLVTGPFDNVGGKGFTKVHDPEWEVDLSATYQGADATGPVGPFGWKEFETRDRLGEVELNTPLGARKGAVAYAWTQVVASKAQPIEIRYSSKCATKVYVNSRLVSIDETYHSGSPFDQHVAEAKLRAGENTVMIKVCQNEQTEPWAQTWSFALRLTGPAGEPLQQVVSRIPEVKP